MFKHLRVVRKCAALADLGGWHRWGLLVVLALAVSGFEAVGALLIYALLGLVAGQGEALELPVVGDLRAVLPDVGDATLMVWAAIIIAVFFIARAGLVLGKTYVTARVLENSGARLSRQLADGYLGMPYAFHLNRNSAELIRNAYSTSVELVHKIFYPLIKIASEGFVVVALLTVLLITAPAATALVVVLLGPAALALLHVVNPRLKALGREKQDVSKASIKSLQQSLGGVRDIKVLGRERFFQEEFGRTRAQLARVKYRHAVVDTIPAVGMETVLVIFIAILFGATVLIEGAAADAIPILGLFAYAALRLKPSVAGIANSVNALRFGSAGFEDVQQDLLLTQGAAAASGEGDIDPLRFEHEIEFDGVSFRYEGAPVDAIMGVSARIRRGQSVGIVGPTGGGKTTLVDLMLGLLEPTEGAVRVDGVDIRGRVPAWQKNIGMVPQTLFLIDDTLRRNIALGLDDDRIDENRIERAVRMAQLDDVVAELPRGLDTIVGEGGVRLSGGQRQRVAIARALYRDPEIVIFDEGTSALDNVTEAELLGSLDSLRGERTLIIVAHRLASVRGSDHILFVQRGRIVSAGAYDDLEATDPRFRDFALGTRTAASTSQSEHAVADAPDEPAPRQDRLRQPR
jgi:ATP-binding cassette, subfamily B, bacterial PglK